MTQEQVLDKYAKARQDVLRAVQDIRRKFTLLDCFCGMGGVSDGFAMEGFDVTGIDIVDAPKMLGYKHKFIQADMMTLKGEDFRGYDVIWGSPPCRDFTNLDDSLWKRKKNAHRGLVLVHTFLAFVEDAKPKFWIMENVFGVVKYLDIEPQVYGAMIKGQKKHAFYGNFPDLLLPQCNPEWRMGSGFPKTASWERAKIPLACSRAFAKACKEKFLETQTT